MALENLLNLSFSKEKKIGISEERVAQVLPKLRDYVAFWREYPDLFVDFMSTGGDPDKKVTFHLLFYQRVFLRIGMRFKYVYAVYPRKRISAGYNSNIIEKIYLIAGNS